MKTTLLGLALGLVSLAGTTALAQDDLDKLLSDGKSKEPDYTLATFKATRIINLHTVENLRAHHLDFRIHHRFGTLNSGVENFWGLDAASIRLSLEYGITDDLMVGIGRSSIQKMVDGFVKYRILRQANDGMPVTLSVLGNAAVNTLGRPFGFDGDGVTWDLTNRMSYAGQVLVARKFTENLSLQLSPTVVHRNVVETKQDQNTVYAIGAGGRYKLSKRLSLTGEYIYQLPGRNREQYWDALSVGLDIETGGHVFQLFCSNAPGMVEQHFVAMNNGGWGKGNIHFGFNISRVFSLKRDAEAKW